MKMSAPLKPWERPSVNQQNIGSVSLSGEPGVSQFLSTNNTSNVGGTRAPMAPPPPLPPRPSNTSLGGGSYMGSTYGSNFGHSPYGASYGGMYSPYNNYSSFGGFGGGYRPSYMNNYDVNSFTRFAEESSRPAFQSIESIVQAFGSVSMMLDSTFQAVYNSFRAVIGVADNFSRLKSQLLAVLSALTIFRTLKYIYHKLLVLIRLRPPGHAERVWEQVASAQAEAAAGLSNSGFEEKKSIWPIAMFFGIIFGAPWLIWKLLSSFVPTQAKGWACGEEDHFVAEATYSFRGERVNELSFTTGQKIIVAPKEIQPQIKGWLLASVDGKKEGIIPVNYVQILGKKKGSKHNKVTATSDLIQNNTDNRLNTSNEVASVGVGNSDSFEAVFDSVSYQNNTPLMNSNGKAEHSVASDILENGDEFNLPD